MAHTIAKFAVAALTFCPLMAQANEASSVETLNTARMSSQSSASSGIMFTLGAGISAQPDYPGADDYGFGPDMKFRLHAVNYGGQVYGNTDPYAESLGFSMSGSFRYVGERDSSDYSELAGLDDVDQSFELGLGVNYGGENYKVYGDVRYGVVGHHTWVGEFGADLIMRPTDRLTLSMGPRAFWGTQRYADTYFGVSDEEAAASGLDAYSPDGGFLSAGVEVGAKYRFDGGWGVEGAVRYDKLLNDAADSPIVEAGNDEQWRMNLDVTKVFTMGTF